MRTALVRVVERIDHPPGSDFHPLVSYRCATFEGVPEACHYHEVNGRPVPVGAVVRAWLTGTGPVFQYDGPPA